MFPLKSLVLAAGLAVAFGPHVNACPAHNHMQTVAAPEVEAQDVATASTAADAVTDASADAQPAEVAAAGQAASPTAN